MTPGHRVRVLAEMYDSRMSAEQANEFARDVESVLAKHFPELRVVTHVESNPPADEVAVDVAQRGFRPLEGWTRVARAVRRRREELGMTQAQVAIAGGPSVAVLTKVENAQRTGYESVVLNRLEKVLGWKPGGIDSIRRGEQPSPVDLPVPPAGAEAGLDAIRDAVADIAAKIERQADEIAELRDRMNRDIDLKAHHEREG